MTLFLLEQCLFQVWERRFAFAYFFAAWNLLAYLGYNYYKNKKMGVKMIEDGETLGIMHF